MDKAYTNPVTGDSLRFMPANGDALDVEVMYQPAHVRPVAHFHPSQTEHFEVLEGCISVSVAGETREYPAGQAFDVPPGVVHTMWNAGDSAVRMHWQTRPALKTRQFFETIWGLAQAGRFGDRGGPNLLQAAVLMRTYADEFRPASPPPAIQAVLFGLLAPIGRWLGYPAHFSE